MVVRCVCVCGGVHSHVSALGVCVVVRWVLVCGGSHSHGSACEGMCS